MSARWKASGIRAILHLRLDILNHRWDDRRNYLRRAAWPKKNGPTRPAGQRGTAMFMRGCRRP
jgi:hypothetical protein